MPKLHVWEEVTPYVQHDTNRTHRMAVVGGYIYRHHSSAGMAMVFVPMPHENKKVN